MELHLHPFLFISLSSLLFYYADAICVPRNFTHPVPSSPTLISHPPPPQSPPHVSHPPPQPVSCPPPVSQPPPPPPQPVSSPPTVSPAIKTICFSTDNPILCLSSIIPFLTGKIDPISILEMEIKACTLKTQAAIAEATRIAKNPSTPSMVATILGECKESYCDALDNLQNAIGAIPTRDIGTINSMLSAVVTDFETCEEEFFEMPGGLSPMSHFDEILGKLASNCLAIASLIK